MKAFITIFVICSIALRPLMPLADYVMNYDYISQELCENKSKTEMDCKGKCYLAKELSKSAENSAKENVLKLSSFSDFFVIDVFNLDRFYITKESQSQKFFLNSFYQFSLDFKIFHPPLI